MPHRIQNKTLRKMEKANLDSLELRSKSIYNNGEIAIVTDLKDLDMREEAFKSDLYAVVLCTAGHASISINGQKYEARENDMMVCTPNIIITSGMMSVDFKSKCLCMSASYLQRLVPLLDNSWNVRMVLESNPLVKLSEEEAATFSLYYDLICSRLDGTSGKYLQKVIDALFQAFFYEFRNSVDRISDESPRPFSSREGHFRAFMDLLSNAYPKPRSVAYYAEHLCITPKYLSTVCKEVCGETPSDIIERFVKKDIEYQLTHTSKSIKDIAYELGFPNISFFGKYVKNCLGMSPKALRDKCIKEKGL